MSLGEVSQISEDIYAYLQPDGSWYLNNTGFLVSPTGVISSKIFLMPNGSWVTFTGPTSSWTGPDAATRSTWPLPCWTWWRTTAASH